MPCCTLVRFIRAWVLGNHTVITCRDFIEQVSPIRVRGGLGETVHERRQVRRTQSGVQLDLHVWQRWIGEAAVSAVQAGIDIGLVTNRAGRCKAKVCSQLRACLDRHLLANGPFQCSARARIVCDHTVIAIVHSCEQVLTACVRLRRINPARKR